MDNRREEMLFCAEKLLYYNDLLLKQCSSWLSEEEGVKNVEKRIRNRDKKKIRIFCRTNTLSNIV
ncbi:MAG: hypothetical protein FWG54_05480 [Bacteroidetes bacterium]|nr:hypothetical protein [Bacteroidota bacterium]